MQNVLVVAGGPVNRELLRHELTKNPMKVVAVDGGGACLAEVGYRPDLLIGDFDSLSEAVVQQMIRDKVEILRFPVEKDETDLELALDWLLRQGVTEARVIGGLGARLDHTLANIGLLVHSLNSGMTVRLIDETHEIYLIRQRTELTAKPGWAVSLIPLTEAKGVVTKGLKYPLRQEDLYFEHSRGLHNCFVSKDAVVDLESGMLLVISFLESEAHSIPVI